MIREENIVGTDILGGPVLCGCALRTVREAGPYNKEYFKQILKIFRLLS